MSEMECRICDVSFPHGAACSYNVTIYSSAVLSINARESWLGIGAVDNTMSLFCRPYKISSWKLYRTTQKTPAMVRCVPSDVERKKICSSGRNGMIRLKDATINI